MKPGDILQHKLTKEKVLVKDITDTEAIIRLSNYAEIMVKKFELEEVKE